MSGSWHGGKGSSPRPLSVSQEEFGNRWDAIFGKKDTEHAKVEKQSSSETEEGQQSDSQDLA